MSSVNIYIDILNKYRGFRIVKIQSGGKDNARNGIYYSIEGKVKSLNDNDEEWDIIEKLENGNRYETLSHAKMVLNRILEKIDIDKVVVYNPPIRWDGYKWVNTDNDISNVNENIKKEENYYLEDEQKRGVLENMIERYQNEGRILDVSVDCVHNIINNISFPSRTCKLSYYVDTIENTINFIQNFMLKESGSLGIYNLSIDKKNNHWMYIDDKYKNDTSYIVSLFYFYIL